MNCIENYNCKKYLINYSNECDLDNELTKELE